MKTMSRTERHALLSYWLLIEAGALLHGWSYYQETRSTWLALNLFFSINTLLMLPALASRKIFWTLLPGVLYLSMVLFVHGVEHVLNRAIDYPDLFLVLETNRHEAGEFIAGHGLLLLIVGTSLLLLVGTWLTRRIRISKNFIYALFVLAGTSVMTGLPGSEIGIVKKISDFALQTVAAAEMSKRDYRQRASFAFGAEKQSEPAVFILVVGESARYDRWGVNGYARNTSPRLDSVAGLISYSDVFAAANGTKHAVPILLSRATPENFFDAFNERSIAGLFEEAGYATAWYTTHDLDIYEPDAKIVEKVKYGIKDEALIDIARKLVQTHDRLFLVLHMSGSHYDYDKRVPPEFVKFKPTLSDAAGFDRRLIGYVNPLATKQELDNSYDNTILYTDYVLGGIIDLLASEQRPAALLYTSDHGESLWDDERKLIYHMRSIEEVGLAELKVPLFIYGNASYRKTHAQTWQRLGEGRHKPVSHSHVFHTMAAMADIRYPERNDSLSLADAAVMTRRPRSFIGPAGKVRSEEGLR